MFDFANNFIYFSLSIVEIVEVKNKENNSMKNRFEAQKKEDFRAVVEEKLLKARTVLIYGAINQEVAQAVTEKLLILSAESKDEIKVYINSQGGHVESADTIFDMLQYCRAPIKVIGTGWVASAGALIFVAPPKENRFCLPNTRFMIHQPLGGMSGSAVDLAIEAKEISRMKRRLNEIIAKQTGQPLERVEQDTDRNFWMSASEAKEYGIVGQIVRSADAF
ncbi:ATP-dependent Clp protease proteolytic subunit [candidate division KSB1 bacterium]|nr:ATP-dependent Clp protease proteolytic subunit [candidate division KSB1 bacterium]NIR73064.1 ATP-dependent Clp protease proteolytic subunit [candidate division KSB1 bacterium]NIS28305.1 ATP-dependent Clp protease proteolytic subunit [candidate division KSB1 bacterium]NIT75174.1 ATP-dependent Clp protease proteolytic subunit [candidate division KSB1 bacterium]NIU29011.1 ATP-dependent Clp protease proteolytic subunit [candidate division KSB1 bacterium]